MAQVSLGVARERGVKCGNEGGSRSSVGGGKGTEEWMEAEGRDVLGSSAFIFSFDTLSKTFFLVSCSSDIYFKSDTAFVVGYPPETTLLKWV